MTRTKQPSTFGSISETKEYLFFFGHSEGFWANTLAGFSHCYLGQPSYPFTAWVIFEPLFQEGSLYLMPEPFELPVNTIALRVRIKSRYKNRLIKPTFQTCSTLVQYMAGIDLGTITPQGLYEALTLSDDKWLKRRGVLEVSEWVKSLEV